MTLAPPAAASPDAMQAAAERLRAQAERAGLGPIADKVLAGTRLTVEDGHALYACPDLFAVGALANHVRERLHGDVTYFNVNQHVNYTNLCNRLCKFCAFQRLPGQEGAYLMTPEDAAQKITEQLDEPVTEVHVVGGVWPKLDYAYYLDLLRAIKSARPAIHIKGFTMVELDEIIKQAGKPVAEVLAELRAAGLDSCPGGGAEVFDEGVRQATYPKKMPGTRWLELASAVHEAGLFSNCTMLHGHVETPAHRVDHLDRLRKLQDHSLSKAADGWGHLQAYIPLSFHPDNSEMADVPAPTALDELREIAVARLMLDNVPHIKAYWILMDIPTAQTALSFGANDVDGTVVEEKIYHEAGATTPQEVQRAELVRWIEDAGRTAIERNTVYEPIGDARGLFA
ncbi:MAG: aminofutalosine synthase MqnE [Planctomycetota bacterium]|nr:aminofutalosine synthase MqnE [Planctomycetota bacterium]